MFAMRSELNTTVRDTDEGSQFSAHETSAQTRCCSVAKRLLSHTYSSSSRAMACCPSVFCNYMICKWVRSRCSSVNIVAKLQAEQSFHCRRSRNVSCLHSVYTGSVPIIRLQFICVLFTSNSDSRLTGCQLLRNWY